MIIAHFKCQQCGREGDPICSELPGKDLEFQCPKCKRNSFRLRFEQKLTWEDNAFALMPSEEIEAKLRGEHNEDTSNAS